MRHSLALKRFLAFGLSGILSVSVWASADFSAEEQDTVTKEDIAAAQVMLELCPTYLGDNKALKDKVHAIINEYVAELSDTSLTYDKLQKDAEYITVLAQAKLDTKEVSAEEQKENCQEIASS